MTCVEYKGVALVVDDIQDNRMLFSSILGQLQLKVLNATNGKEAVDLVTEMTKRRDRLDIIFIDIMMPEMSGIEATKLIRAIPYKGPILAVSANTMSDTSKAAKDVGINQYFEKSTFNLKLAKALLLVHCGMEL